MNENENKMEPAACRRKLNYEKFISHPFNPLLTNLTESDTLQAHHKLMPLTPGTRFVAVCVFSGFLSGVNEIFALLVCYAE